MSYLSNKSRLTTLCSAGAAVLLNASAASAAPDYDVFIESTEFPIRVLYPNSVAESVAQQVLGFSEDAWQEQVVEMGFPTPVAEDENGQRVPGLWVYLDPDAPGDHVEPVSDNPDTPWTDCTVHVVIRTFSPTSYLELVSHHEANHALQMSADCGESAFAYEQTCVATTTLSMPDDQLFPQYFLPVFQAYPQSGLDCTFYYDEDKRYFHYGASLFSLFLEDAYGSYDGTMISGIWEAAKQNGSVTSVGMGGATLDVPNDPHLLDAMATVLGETPFDEAFTTFAQWRYFVGARDDGEHFRDGAKWGGGEVAIDTALTLDQLPVLGGTPTEGPSDYGSVYLTLDLESMDDDHGIELSFSGDAVVSWAVDVMLLADGQPPQVERVPESGLLALEGLSDFREAVIVVSNLSDGAHTPESPMCSESVGFSYDLQVVDVASPPAISSVDPAQLTVGTSEYVWVSGQDFAADLTVELSASGITIDQVDFVDAATVGVSLTVAPDAALGPRDLTVTNPNGKSGALSGALTVVAVAAAAPPPEESSGCSCSLPGATPVDSAPWAGLLGLGLWLGVCRRRR